MIDNMEGNAINKLKDKMVVADNRAEYEVIVKKGSEVIYHNKVYAGVMNLVQEDLKLDPTVGTIEGDSQAFVFGNPIEIVFAWDQTKQKLQKVFLKCTNITRKIIASARRGEGMKFNKITEKI